MPRHPASAIEVCRTPFRGAEAVRHGLITRARLSGPRWRRLLPDVYLRADALLDHLTWCQAALLITPPGTVLGFRSALGLYCPTLRPGVDDPVHLITPGRARLRSHTRLNVHEMALIPAETTTCGGFPVTTPTRTAFDLARDSNLVEAVIGVDALLASRRTTKSAIAPYATLGVPGSRRAARVLDLSNPGSESPMETRTRILLVLGGLPRPVVQYEVYHDGLFIARLDLAYPERRLGLEYDGEQHRDRQTFRNDAVRANLLSLAAWTVLRFTADDVLRHPARMVAQVRALLSTARP